MNVRQSVIKRLETDGAPGERVGKEDEMSLVLDSAIARDAANVEPVVIFDDGRRRRKRPRRRTIAVAGSIHIDAFVRTFLVVNRAESATGNH